MPRVKRGVTARRKHKKVLQFVEGHRGTRRRLIKKARESMMHALAYAYRDRRNRKRDMRRLWITRINAAARMFGVTYSQLMHAIRIANISVDRKILAEMAVNDRPAFAELVKTAMAAVQSQGQPQVQAQS
ncbi:50S ribosomal protein L20 [Thermogemmatispora sp.]|uniref:50S ribosomal protein L20 n=1 Tax=Thermogemmatispora sp. TaxID=1968838 RepID=UPI001DC775AE|nr:50S ribosomal protein L20 [Thermogemmatispora sp.]MBX5448842.1 50S ribosomal protein L20 [Thermogemmatispora sp.]